VSRRGADHWRAAALVLLVCVTGCSVVRNPDSRAWETHRERSTLGDFLGDSPGVSGPETREIVHPELPIRIGLAFLLPGWNRGAVIPSAEQRLAALEGVRAAILTQPYVSEVVIIPEHYLERGAVRGFENLRDLAKRFDWDLLAVLASDQTSYESRNFRSLGLITIIGGDFWKGDVDQTVTVIDLAFVDPTSRNVVMRVASAATFGDTTSLLDDWRSSEQVRSVSFDEAREALIAGLPEQLAGLRSQLQPALHQRP